jgi:hypothetical protein
MPSSGARSTRIVPKHHPLVRLTQWVNVPLLFGLIASGLAIYWAAPVFFHAYDPVLRTRDYFVSLGAGIAHLLGDRSDPRLWFYNHLSLGPQQLAVSLRWHWALAYLFMLNGALYFVGLALGGGWRALLPRRSDFAEALGMMRYYGGVIPMAILRRPWPPSGHPLEVQRAAKISIFLDVAVRSAGRTLGVGDAQAFAARLARAAVRPATTAPASCTSSA